MEVKMKMKKLESKKRRKWLLKTQRQVGVWSKKSLMVLKKTEILGKTLRCREGSKVSRFFRVLLEGQALGKQKMRIWLMVGGLWLAGVPLSRNASIAKIEPNLAIEAVTVTESSFQNPLGLAQYQKSQHFGFLHPGVDMAADKGTAVWAVAQGEVVEVKTGGWSGYGNVVWVEHYPGQVSLYAHLDKVLVKEGQEVDKGSVLGTVGDTGWSTGNHLHFQISENGVWMNPERLISL